MRKPKTMLVVVQEGGSTGELYAHAFTRRRDADRFRRVYTPEVLDRLRALSAIYDPAHILVAGRGLA